MESFGASSPASPAASFRSVEFSPNTSFGSTDMSTDASLGYDFEDSETRAQLELIDDLQKLGVSDHIALPQASSSPSLKSKILIFIACCRRRSEHREKLCPTSCDRNSISYQWWNVHSLCNRNSSSENVFWHGDDSQIWDYTIKWWIVRSTEGSQRLAAKRSGS